MNLIVVNLLKEYLPYLIAFLLGVVVAWKGCGTTSGKPVTETIEVETPVFVTEYVDRWRVDTVRFVEKQIVTHYDTVTNEILKRDTVFTVDTVSIVETWLTEVNTYDTLVTFEDASVSLKWNNYQNRSENLFVTHSYKKVEPSKFALGVHGNVGLISDFKDKYTPLMGLGLQITSNKMYYAADYGYNGDHFIGVSVGRNFISR